MKQELLNQIEKVPMLPETIMKLEKAYANPECTIVEIADIIKADPLISAFVLKTANSPLYGLSRSIVDVSHAVSLLGKDSVRAFAVAAAANNCLNIDLSPYGMTKDNYMQKSQLQNALITNWILKVDKDMLPNLSLASFLLELGKVIISNYLITTAQKSAILNALSINKTITQAELDACGAKSEDITASLFFKWNFNPDIVHLIRYANEPEDAMDEETKSMAPYLKVAKECVTLKGEINNESLEKARKLLEEYELATEPFENAVQKIMNVA